MSELDKAIFVIRVFCSYKTTWLLKRSSKWGYVLGEKNEQDLDQKCKGVYGRRMVDVLSYAYLLSTK